MEFDAWQHEVDNIATDYATIARLAEAADASKPDTVVDTICSALASTTPDSDQRLQYWKLIDRLCKVNSAFIPVITKRLVTIAYEFAPAKSNKGNFAIFLVILDSMKHFLGQAVVAVAKAKIGANEGLNEDDNITFSNLDHQQNTDRAPRALVVHRAALSTMGGFMTRKDNTQRSGPPDALMVRTRDSLTAMKAANAYAPAMAVEIAQAPVQSDVDAPAGFRQALPANHTEEYRRLRQKRLRETFEQAHKDEEDRKNKKAIAELERQTAAAYGGGSAGASVEANTSGNRTNIFDFSDVVMPSELPRDEYGVQIANFPLGVRFLREAIESCGGALELETIVQRLSTLSGFDKDKFGNVREFVTIHSPTFVVQQEKDKWVVRVKTAEDDVSVPPRIQLPDGNIYFSWERMFCPLCGKELKGRNLARHSNCRGCIKTQIAKAFTGQITSDIGRLHAFGQELMARYTEAMKEGYSLVSGAVFDDGDLEYFESCLIAAAKVKRYQLSSTRHFSLILKAIGVVRARWLAIHNVTEIKDIQVGPSDQPFVKFFATLGSLIHRLPIAWIETGDIIDMCSRFCQKPLPAHNPPPRPADPRIQMTNEYPGVLFCDSEIDSEDEVSAEDDEVCSDDEQEQFVLAPPVSVVESLMTVGFERDTKRLEYRLRTRPPMVLRKALRLGGNATQAEVYNAKE